VSGRKSTCLSSICDVALAAALSEAWSNVFAQKERKAYAARNRG
jgi:hypothetical protein